MISLPLVAAPSMLAILLVAVATAAVAGLLLGLLDRRLARRERAAAPSVKPERTPLAA
jgi:hypothetical protein